MAGDFTRWLANETAAALTHDTPRPACRTCNDTGIVWSPDPDGESAYESACPAPGCVTPYPVAADFSDAGEEPF